MKMINKAKILVLGLCVTILPNSFAGITSIATSERTVPFTVNIHPVGVLFGNLKGELGVGLTDKIALGILGSYTEGRLARGGFDGASYGALGYFFLTGQGTDSVYVKPEFEHGFLRGNDTKNGGTVDYNMVKLIAGYHWIWENGVNLNLGGGANYTFGKANFKEEPDVQLGNIHTKVRNGPFAGLIPTIEFSLGWSLLNS